MQNLSLRLSTIANLVPIGAKVCDIGTDHGFLPIVLKARGIAKSVIATDINEKPLKKAVENIKKSGVEGISLRLCDGLDSINKDEADTVIIAGMGGEVISGILSRGISVVNNGQVTLILQPTTSPEFLREYLYSGGFEILKEIPIEENAKLYSVMLCRYCGVSQKKENYLYFSGSVDPENPIGKKYIEKQKNRVFKCMEALENIPAKEQEYNYYKEIFEGLWHLIQDC